MGNKPEGGIPKELTKLQELKKLYLNGNPRVGVIPPGLAGLNALEELNLGLSILKSVSRYGHARTV